MRDALRGPGVSIQLGLVPRGQRRLSKNRAWSQRGRRVRGSAAAETGLYTCRCPAPIGTDSDGPVEPQPNGARRCQLLRRD